MPTLTSRAETGGASAAASSPAALLDGLKRHFRSAARGVLFAEQTFEELLGQVFHCIRGGLLGSVGDLLSETSLAPQVLIHDVLIRSTVLLFAINDVALGSLVLLLPIDDVAICPFLIQMVVRDTVELFAFELVLALHPIALEMVVGGVVVRVPVPVVIIRGGDLSVRFGRRLGRQLPGKPTFQGLRHEILVTRTTRRLPMAWRVDVAFTPIGALGALFTAGAPFEVNVLDVESLNVQALARAHRLALHH